MAGGSADKSILETPTWSVATVCAVFVIISVLIEHGIESLGKLFRKRQNKAMMQALEKIKAELMILGFISLLLTVGTSQIARICIPSKLGGKWFPCREGGGDHEDDDFISLRKLLSYADDAQAGMITWRRRRSLAATDVKNYCDENEIPMISYSAAHQLHLFIFVLAVVHVLYSVILMFLGQIKMKKWKAWELETSSMAYQFTNDPARFRFAHQTSFVRRHSGLSKIPGIRWIVAMVRQFFGSISKVDYVTIRNGFINAHFAPNSKFDFHKYIKRCMEDDFKRVLGISIPLWFFTIILLLLNVYHWYTFTWISLVPLFILVLVGTKLELVIMEMARQIQDRNTVVRGAPVVEPSNDFFWFNRPGWILFLIHFTLFENAFQLAYFLWSWYEFGSKSCMHENLIVILLRVFLGVALHILCSYIIFPLYALVTQMGSHMKKSIFEEQTAKALKKWQKAAKERKKLRKVGAATSPSSSQDASNCNAAGGFMSGETTPSTQGTSPLYLLHKYHRSDAAEYCESIPNSPRTCNSDTDLSEFEDSNIHGSHDASDLTNQKSDTTLDFTFVQP